MEAARDPSRAAGDRPGLIAELAGIVCRRDAEHPVRVAVDGVTASGKSTLARELAAAVNDMGRPAIHLTMDGFHHPRHHHYRTRLIDLASDRQIDEEPIEAPDDAVLIVDGTFLQRPEFADRWDERIYVEVTLSVAYERGTRRDADALGGLDAARDMYEGRYHAACRLYLAEVDPVRRATIVVENDDLDNPRMRVGPRPPSNAKGA